MWLHNKTLLLTGASGGIGQALAQRLAAAGARLVLAGRDPQKLQHLCETLPGPGHRWLAADMTTEAGLQQLAEAARISAIDGLINNAGIGRFALLEETPPADLQAMLAVNLLAPVRLCQLLLPLLKARPEALIVNVGSTYGGLGYPGYSGYCATKFGLRGFSEALRRELADSAVQVLYVAPRATVTDMNDERVNAMNAHFKARSDAPEWVAGAIVAACQRRRVKSCLLGWPEKFFVRLNGLLPGLVDRALRKQLPVIRQYALQTKV